MEQMTRPDQCGLLMLQGLLLSQQPRAPSPSPPRLHPLQGMAVKAVDRRRKEELEPCSVSLEAAPAPPLAGCAAPLRLPVPRFSPACEGTASTTKQRAYAWYTEGMQQQQVQAIYESQETVLGLTSDLLFMAHQPCFSSQSPSRVQERVPSHDSGSTTPQFLSMQV